MLYYIIRPQRGKTMNDLELLTKTERKEIYDLKNGYILKKYINLSNKAMTIYRKKLLLAKELNVVNLIGPSNIYSENGIITGCIERKINGISFGNYLREKRKRKEPVTLDDVGYYYVKKHEIVMKANEEDIHFPDGSYNNFFINEKTKDIYAIDWEGMQIKGITSLEFNDAIFNKNNLFIIRNKKYIKNGLINKNMDIYMMGIEFLYLTTKIDLINQKIKSKEEFIDFLNLVNFPSNELREKLELLYDSKEDNRYFKEELGDFIKEYTLTSDRKGVPRIYIKK